MITFLLRLLALLGFLASIGLAVVSQEDSFGIVFFIAIAVFFCLLLISASQLVGGSKR